jgi:hypothetical protein
MQSSYLTRHRRAGKIMSAIRSSADALAPAGGKTGLHDPFPRLALAPFPGGGGGGGLACTP